MQKLNLKRNDTLFEQDAHLRGKEFVLTIVFHKSIMANLFDFLETASPGIKLESAAEEENPNASSEIQLEQCFQNYKQSETLDGDNEWNCNKCQEHVQATKTLEIYRVPKIMIVSLKRFRNGFGGGQKIDTLVKFPLEGLDMRPFVLLPEQRNAPELIYDCFGISNHFGSVGSGHYTAYAKNPRTNQWYHFNDRIVSPISSESSLVTKAAYNLFFRLRDPATTMENLDLDSVTQRPDMEFLRSLEEQKEN